MNIRKIILEEIKYSIFEGIEHIQNLYKSWANKKSGDPEAAMKIMDDVIANRRSLPKKDFAKYISYEELVNDLNKIKKAKASDDVTKFYEDKDLLVMAANTWEASCKYGSGSKWCTTAKDTSSYWRRHNETGTEFFWIFKNVPDSDPNHKFSYHIKVDGGSDWCNSVNSCMSKLPENSYPKQHPKYNEIIDNLQNFHNTREFKAKTPFSQDIRDINYRFINNLVDTNYDNIMQQIINNEDLGNLTRIVFKDAIDEFIYEMERDMVPDGVDIDEWEENEEMREVFFYQLENYLNDGIKTYDFMQNLDGIIFQRGLQWDIDDLLIRYFHLDPNLSYEEQLEERGITITNIIDELDLTELLSEAISSDIMYFLEDMAWQFSQNWEY